MDEWTEFDIADPRYGTWALCWPDNQHERYGTLPCPNMTYRDGQWVSPLWCKRDSFRDLVCAVAAALTPNALPPDSGWKYFGARNETLVRRLNAEAANDWLPAPDCSVAEVAAAVPGCAGGGDSGTDYYRTAHGSYTDMMMYYIEKMLRTFADGVYCMPHTIATPF